ncbi:Triadin [Balamuthia mandrillaris]
MSMLRSKLSWCLVVFLLSANLLQYLYFSGDSTRVAGVVRQDDAMRKDDKGTAGAVEGVEKDRFIQKEEDDEDWEDSFEEYEGESEEEDLFISPQDEESSWTHAHKFEEEEYYDDEEEEQEEHEEQEQEEEAAAEEEEEEEEDEWEALEGEENNENDLEQSEETDEDYDAEEEGEGMGPELQEDEAAEDSSSSEYEAFTDNGDSQGPDDDEGEAEVEENEISQSPVHHHPPAPHPPQPQPYYEEEDGYLADALLYNISKPYQHKHQRAIFVSTAGHTGTTYLRDLLMKGEHVISLHEATPPMNGGIMLQLNSQRFEENFARRYDMKVGAIKRHIATEEQKRRAEKELKPGERLVYIETNHMFIKTFWDVVLSEEEWEFDIIILRRNLVSTARLVAIARCLRSMLSNDNFNYTAKSGSWRQWKETTGSVNAAFDPPLRYDNDTRYGEKRRNYLSDVFDSPSGRCFRYLIDIEMRGMRLVKLKKDAPNVRFHHIRLEDIAVLPGARDVFDRLNLTPMPERSGAAASFLVPSPKNGHVYGKSTNEQQRKLLWTKYKLYEFLLVLASLPSTSSMLPLLPSLSKPTAANAHLAVLSVVVGDEPISLVEMWLKAVLSFADSVLLVRLEKEGEERKEEETLVRWLRDYAPPEVVSVIDQRTLREEEGARRIAENITSPSSMLDDMGRKAFATNGATHAIFFQDVWEIPTANWLHQRLLRHFVLSLSGHERLVLGKKWMMPTTATNEAMTFVGVAPGREEEEVNMEAVAPPLSWKTSSAGFFALSEHFTYPTDTAATLNDDEEKQPLNYKSGIFDLRPFGSFGVLDFRYATNAQALKVLQSYDKCKQQIAAKTQKDGYLVSLGFVEKEIKGVRLLVEKEWIKPYQAAGITLNRFYEGAEWEAFVAKRAQQLQKWTAARLCTGNS